MTAHPKICPRTGELHFFGYDFTPPYLTYHVADAAGTLITSRGRRGAGRHDDARLQPHRTLRRVHGPARRVRPRARAGRHACPTGSTPTTALASASCAATTRTATCAGSTIEPCYVFHPLNAHDDGTSITIDVVRHADLWFDGEATPRQRCGAGRIDLAAGTRHRATARRSPVRVPPRRRPARQPASPARLGHSTPRHHPDGVGAITVYDLDTTRQRSTSTPSGRGASPVKPCSLPRTTATNHGWLLTYVYDALQRPQRSRRSSTSTDVTDEPVAICTYPTEYRTASTARGSRTPQQVTRWTNTTLRSPRCQLCRGLLELAFLRRSAGHKGEGVGGNDAKGDVVGGVLAGRRGSSSSLR